jgi:NitT/TauT family transport system substrate-binding protein
MKRLAWIDDEVSWQFAAAFTSAKLANNQRALVERFLAAYRHAMRDYHNAFTGPGEKRQDGPMANDIERLIAHSIDRPVADVANSVAYADADARLDVADVRRQIAWYEAQGMLKSSIDSEALIDRRYVVALHGK